MEYIIALVVVIFIICYMDSKNTTAASSSSSTRPQMNESHISVYYAELLIRITMNLIHTGLISNADDVYVSLTDKGAWCSIESYYLAQAINGNLSWNNERLLEVATPTDWNNFKKIDGLHVEDIDEVRLDLRYYAPDSTLWYKYVKTYVQSNYPNQSEIHFNDSNESILIRK